MKNEKLRPTPLKYGGITLCTTNPDTPDTPDTRDTPDTPYTPDTSCTGQVRVRDRFVYGTGLCTGQVCVRDRTLVFSWGATWSRTPTGWKLGRAYRDRNECEVANFAQRVC